MAKKAVKKPKTRKPKHDPIVIEFVKQKPGCMVDHWIMSLSDFAMKAADALNWFRSYEPDFETSSLFRAARLSTLEGNGAERIGV
jgi:hypothetical protein